MLLTVPTQTVSALSILQEAVLAEQGYELLKVKSVEVLRFDQTSVSSSIGWPRHSLKALARCIHPSLARICEKFSEAAVKGCITSCLPCVAKRVNKFGINLVVKDFRVESVAGWRSLQVKPSTILQSLASAKMSDILVEYGNNNLVVNFLVSGVPAFAIRTGLRNGWALEYATVYYDGQPRFSRWVIHDWPSAFFMCKSFVESRCA